MTREIKFRAWDKIRKRMVYDIVFTYDKDDTFNNMYDEEDRQIENKEIMQFTGLKDKNGKEIFEGDIVEDLSLNNRIGIVVFHNWSFGFEGNRFHYFYPFNTDMKLKVIGNKFENPELLRQEKKNE